MSSRGADGVVLADSWTLEPADLDALVGKQGATVVGFAVLLKYFRWKGRFPDQSYSPNTTGSRPSWPAKRPTAPSGTSAACRVLAGWRSQAMIEAPSHLRRHSGPVTLTLLAALVFCREREVTDALVELFIATVHRIAARAGQRVIEELVNEFRRVTGKETEAARV